MKTSDRHATLVKSADNQTNRRLTATRTAGEGRGKELYGERLKKIREMQGNSLEKAARRPGWTSLYTEIENVKCSRNRGPSSDSPRRSACDRNHSSTGVPFSYSFIRREDRRDTRGPTVNRDQSAVPLPVLRPGAGVAPHYSFIVTASRGRHRRRAFVHEGKEFLYVHEGEITIARQKRKKSCSRATSSIIIDGPHSLRARGGCQVGACGCV
jgi:transcriptional regulator with XRE-family HTH domain